MQGRKNRVRRCHGCRFFRRKMSCRNRVVVIAVMTQQRQVARVIAAAVAAAYCNGRHVQHAEANTPHMFAKAGMVIVCRPNKSMVHRRARGASSTPAYAALAAQLPSSSERQIQQKHATSAVARQKTRFSGTHDEYKAKPENAEGPKSLADKKRGVGADVTSQTPSLVDSYHRRTEERDRGGGGGGGCKSLVQSTSRNSLQPGDKGQKEGSSSATRPRAGSPHKAPKGSFAANSSAASAV